jgi:hypothetical protein
VAKLDLSALDSADAESSEEEEADDGEGFSMEEAGLEE